MKRIRQRVLAFMKILRGNSKSLSLSPSIAWERVLAAVKIHLLTWQGDCRAPLLLMNLPKRVLSSDTSSSTFPHIYNIKVMRLKNSQLFFVGGWNFKIFVTVKNITYATFHNCNGLFFHHSQSFLSSQNLNYISCLFFRKMKNLSQKIISNGDCSTI